MSEEAREVARSLIPATAPQIEGPESTPLLQPVLQHSRLTCHSKTPKTVRSCGAYAYKVALGKFELPTSRLSGGRSIAQRGTRHKTKTSPTPTLSESVPRPAPRKPPCREWRTGSR